jgi:hypothetical protein
VARPFLSPPPWSQNNLLHDRKKFKRRFKVQLVPLRVGRLETDGFHLLQALRRRDFG